MVEKASCLCKPGISPLYNPPTPSSLNMVKMVRNIPEYLLGAPPTFPCTFQRHVENEMRQLLLSIR